MKFIVLLGRFLFALIFICSSIGHFSSSSITYAEASGAPLANLFVPLSGVLILLGGLSILFGFKAKIGAILLLIFLVPATLIMHAFWNIQDPTLYLMQMSNFMKNLSLMGTCLLITYFGSGPLSIDGRI